ncbi:interferon-inducible double-stranded RNA-dependent protein kinase activator A homolog [Periplaneta americana]|uniref:interferon-inducible double-stranded RNA-dependent protein kinase activator A homolog n=1 Tax=Periplaneta americana TaxID=6978 RepID=UPI0037E7AC46
MSDYNSAYSRDFSYHQKGETSSLLINKTPISLLQEWLNHLGMTPKYELLTAGLSINHGHNYYPFSFRVSVGEVEAIGTGRSKKEAKHAAARELLNLLLDGPFSKRQANFTDYTNETVTETAGVMQDNFHNPVGILQEMCTAENWAHPKYVLVSEQGLPHNRVFTISVEVQGMRQTGTGRSKRLAKREAALKMLYRLGPQFVDADSKLSYDEGCTNGFTNNYTKLLEEVAAQQKILVHYQDIEDKTPGGLFQCIVRISTWPIIVCRGQGSTPKLAINNAAMHALDCLSLLVKKRYYCRFVSS